MKEESEKAGLKVNIQSTKIMASGSRHCMANRWGNNRNRNRPYFLGLQNHCRGDCNHEIKRCLLLGRKASFEKPRWCIKKQRHHFADKGLYSQSYGFSSSHVWMWELDHIEGWVPENWCFQTVVLQKTLESSLDCKEIKQVNPKGNQFWIVMRGTDTEAEVPILWLPDAKSYLIEKTLMLGKIESRRRRGRGWDGWGYHQLDGHKFEQVLGVGDGQGSLACCSP